PPPTLPVPPVHPLPRPGVAHDRLVPPASAVAARDHRAGTSRPGPADRAGPGAQSAARRGMPGRGRVALTRRGRNPQPVAGPAVWPPRWRTPGRLHAHLDPDEPRGPTLQQGTPARARRGPGCPAPARNRCGNRRRHRPGRVAAGPGGDRLVGRPRLPPTGPRTAQLRPGRTGAPQPGPAVHHPTHAVLRRAHRPPRQAAPAPAPPPALPPGLTLMPTPALTPPRPTPPLRRKVCRDRTRLPLTRARYRPHGRGHPGRGGHRRRGNGRTPAHGAGHHLCRWARAVRG